MLHHYDHYHRSIRSAFRFHPLATKCVFLMYRAGGGGGGGGASVITNHDPLLQLIIPYDVATMTILSYCLDKTTTIFLKLSESSAVSGNKSKSIKNHPHANQVVIAFGDNAQRLPRFDDFSSSSSSYLLCSLPLHLTHVDLSDATLSKLCHLDQNFLAKSFLTSVDLSGLVNITTVGARFMSMCEAEIDVVDMSSMTGLDEIPGSFLYMSGVRTLVPPPRICKNNITRLGACVLEGCKYFESGQDDQFLSDMTSVQSIGFNFMKNSSIGRVIDLSDLRSLTHIGSDFLNSCTNLECVVGGLAKLQHFSQGFLSRCRNLTFVDLSGLGNVTKIGDNVLSQCDKLAMDVDLTHMTKVEEIGCSFFERSGVLSGYLSGLCNVTNTEMNFFCDCNYLHSIDLSGMSNLKTVGRDFLTKCEHLTKIDFSGVTNVERIGARFMSYSKSVHSVDLRPLFMMSSPSLTKNICYQFMYGSGVETVLI
eukprot:PhM_4_TR18447/c0_g1_i1/m.72854